MRQKKYRAWWSDTGIFIPDFMDEYLIDALNDDAFTVSEYIGIKDKFGKEIWEGDVIKVLDWAWDGRKDDLLGITYVVWSEDDLGFRYKNETLVEDFYDQFRNVLVVGNIYDNPDLIEVSL